MFVNSRSKAQVFLRLKSSREMFMNSKPSVQVFVNSTSEVRKFVNSSSEMHSTATPRNTFYCLKDTSHISIPECLEHSHFCFKIIAIDLKICTVKSQLQTNILKYISLTLLTLAYTSESSAKRCLKIRENCKNWLLKYEKFIVYSFDLYFYHLR